MQHYSNKQLIQNISLILGTAALSELIKIFVQGSQYNSLITFLAVGLVIVGIVLYNSLAQKRINSGKTTKSIAIRSSQFISEFYKSVKKISSSSRWKDVEKEITNDIDSLSRHLLLIGEYKVRLKLGELLVKCSSDELVILSAKLDDIGWTCVMMGKPVANRYFFEVLEKINVRVEKINNQFLVQYQGNSDIDMKKLMLAARAYRHLGSNGFVKAENKIEYNLRGLAIMAHLKDLKPSTNIISENSINGMNAGLYYGLGISYLESFEKLSNKATDEGVTFLVDSFSNNMISKNLSKGFANQHRYIKCLLIENKIYLDMTKINEHRESIFKLSVERNCPQLMEFGLKEYTANLRLVEELINQSIYIDEAYELFLEQKIKHWNVSHE